MLKFAIKIICPIRLERIRNGEKVIVQTGPTEYEVEVSGEPEFISRRSQTARAKNHRSRNMAEPAAVLRGDASRCFPNDGEQIPLGGPKPARIRRLKAGRCYLTPTGVAVQFVGQADGHAIMRSVATNTRFVLPASYPLRPSGGQEANVGPTGGPYGGSGPASAACRGKNVKAGVRARIYWLQKRGMTLRRDDAGRMHIRVA